LGSHLGIILSLIQTPIRPKIG